MNSDIALYALIIFGSVIVGGLITLTVNIHLQRRERKAQYAIQSRHEIYDPLYDEIKQINKALEEFRNPFNARSTLKVWDELKPSIKLRVPESLRQLIENFDIKARKFYELDIKASQVLLNSITEAIGKRVHYDEAYGGLERGAREVFENYKGDFLAGRLLKIRHGHDLKRLLGTEEESRMRDFFDEVCASAEKNPTIIELRKVQRELIEGETKDLEKYLEKKITHILKKYEDKLIKESEKSSKEKTLVDELSPKERIELPILALVVVLSVILSGIYAPEFRALRESESWLEFILLGLILIFFVLFVLTLFLLIIKRFSRRSNREEPIKLAQYLRGEKESYEPFYLMGAL